MSTTAALEEATMQGSSRRRISALVIVAVVGLSGCSGGDDGDVTAAAVTSTTSTGAGPSATASTTVAGSSTCANQGFTPNSDDVAGEIVATGVSCAEVEAFLRKVGPLVGATGGPAQITVDGFACVRTRQDDGSYGLPFADYECTSGAARITFRRT